MPLTLSEYRKKLIGKILSASSQDEVKLTITKAMKGLEDHEAVYNIVHTFADNVLYDLEQFNPINKTSQQWSNIKMAQVCFNHIKNANLHKGS